MLSETSIPAVVVLLELSALGPGDWTRTACDDSLEPVGVPLRESNGAPHISHDSNDGWFENVHRGHWKVALVSLSASPERGVDEPGDEALLKV